MLEDFLRGGFRTAQQGVNRIINEHLAARLRARLSVRRFLSRILVTHGEKLVYEVAKELKNYNRTLLPRLERGLTYGLRPDEKVALLDRTLKLLIEAGTS